MKVLVLGATGFIGGHIAKQALSEGWTVRALRRNPQATGHISDLPIEWVSGTLTDISAITEAMHGIDIVFHAAAFYPKKGSSRNIDTQTAYASREISTLLSAAKNAQVKRFIYTSTLTTIGRPPKNETRLADERDFYIPGSLPKSIYYEAKFHMEKQVLEAALQGLPATVLNPTAVFGPGDVHLTLGGLLIAIARGYGLAYLPGSINVVDVRDVASAHIQAAKYGQIGERYILGGHNLSIKQAMSFASDVAQVSSPKFKVPLPLIDLIVLFSDMLPILPLPTNHLRALRHWQAYNTEKAESHLNLSPRPFEHTVRDALHWFRSQGML
ncbi:MAG: NAD-dependent epimerase/dehydratase family protein [Anaerolineae bacterium]|nr:NAD-dependent epimerase/dehydratase family protein [Anaerolineae bacterium]